MTTDITFEEADALLSAKLPDTFGYRIRRRLVRFPGGSRRSGDPAEEFTLQLFRGAGTNLCELDVTKATLAQACRALIDRAAAESEPGDFDENEIPF